MLQKLFRHEKTTKAFALIGFSITFLKILQYGYSVYKALLRPISNLRERYHTSDCYAVVTGSTDGIGKGFCYKLAE